MPVILDRRVKLFIHFLHMKKSVSSILLVAICTILAAEAVSQKLVNYVSFVNSNIRYPQDKLPQVNQARKWFATGWKGEKVHTQFVVYSNMDITNLSATVSDLTSETGNKITRNNISTGFLRYVMTDEFRDGCGYRKPADFDSSLVEDAIDPAAVTLVSKNTLQPVWLSIRIPANTEPGNYTGTITVTANKPITLEVILTVKNHLLPEPARWTYSLDLWQHPAAIARVHDVALWGPAHYEYMRPYYTMLANAGQKYITTSIIHEPWNHQTYDDFPSLIRWIKTSDGKWRYDYSLFDQYVNFVMSCGITAGINCYSMVPWKLSFQYYDEATQKDTALVAKIGSAEYNDHWSAMLKDFTSHLKEKGWFNITRIAMDERPMEDMKAVIKLLKTIDPNWKIALAGDYHPEIEKDIHDYVIASKYRFDSLALIQRNLDKKISGFYTCCVEAKPNGFTFSPPAEHVWMGWYAANEGFNGYLRWAYNSWTKDPLLDSRFRTWPAGDTYQIYPGPWTSIRFEKMIEGIQDFEKIRILREEFKQTNNIPNQKTLEKAVAVFTMETLDKISALTMMENAKKIMNSF